MLEKGEGLCAVGAARPRIQTVGKIKKEKKDGRRKVSRAKNRQIENAARHDRKERWVTPCSNGRENGERLIRTIINDRKPTSQAQSYLRRLARKNDGRTHVKGSFWGEPVAAEQYTLTREKGTT